MSRQDQMLCIVLFEDKNISNEWTLEPLKRVYFPMQSPRINELVTRFLPATRVYSLTLSESYELQLGEQLYLTKKNKYI